MANTDSRELVAFKIDEEEFAVDISSVQEINRVSEVTRIPNAPSHVQGVINLRGKIIPVVDVRSMLGFRPKGTGTQSRVIVVEVGGMVLGFVVDSVSEVLYIKGSDIEDAHDFLFRYNGNCVIGTAKMGSGLKLILDVDKVIGEVDFGLAA